MNLVKAAELARRHVVALVVAFALIGGTTVAVAAGKSGPNATTIHACVTERYGTLNLSSARATCPRGQRKISWNVAGKTGLRGKAGPRGSMGAKGDPGARGTNGTNGTNGAAGPAGSTGADGAAGPVGSTGAVGPEGPTGEIGPVGPAGPTGDTGPAGGIGPAGPTGDTGPVGPAGPTGATGPQGPAGPAGPPAFSDVGQYRVSGEIGEEVNAVPMSGWTTVVAGDSVFTPNLGVFTPSRAGTYLIRFSATGGPKAAVTISAGSDQRLRVALVHRAVNGPIGGVELTSRTFPVVDVNIALVLSMRAPVRDGSVTGEQYVTLEQGDIVTLRFTNEFKATMDMNAEISFARVG